MNRNARQRDETSFGFGLRYQREPDEIYAKHLDNAYAYQRQPNGSIKRLNNQQLKTYSTKASATIQDYKKVANGKADKEHIENVITDIHYSKFNHLKTSLSSIKTLLNANQETELVRESRAQHKYAKFMNNSYEYYSKKPIKPTKGFKVDVLHHHLVHP